MGVKWMKLKKGLMQFILCIGVSIFAIVVGIIGMIIQSVNPIGLGLLSLVFGTMTLLAVIGFQVVGNYFNINKLGALENIEEIK
jgi:hypothetical protein